MDGGDAPTRAELLKGRNFGERKNEIEEKTENEEKEGIREERLEGRGEGRWRRKRKEIDEEK